MNHGMKIGGQHSWIYKTGNWDETKVAPQTWRFRYEQTKTRKGHRAKYGTGMPLKSRLIWGIKAKQYAIKINPNQYKLIMVGTKKQLNARIGKRKWLKRR